MANALFDSKTKKFNTRAIMARAWAIFRQSYNFPAIAFNRIGRNCFAWAMRSAWFEANREKRASEIKPEYAAEAIRDFRTERENLQWEPSFTRMKAEQERIDRNIAFYQLALTMKAASHPEAA